MGKKYRPIAVEFQSLPVEKQAEILAQLYAPRIKCPYCQREIGDYSNFCPYCTKKLPSHSDKEICTK